MIETFIAQSKALHTSQNLGLLKTYKREDNHFIFKDINAAMSVRVLSPEIIRIRYAPHSAFLPDFSYALQPYDFEKAEITFKDEKDKYVISTSIVKLEIIKEGGKISFFDKNNLLTCEDAEGANWEENHEFGGYNVFCTKNFSTVLV